MKEIMKKLFEAGKKEAFQSIDDFVKAAKEIGYSKEEIDAAMDDYEGLPLDDESLMLVAGGAEAVNDSSVLGLNEKSRVNMARYDHPVRWNRSKLG